MTQVDTTYWEGVERGRMELPFCVNCNQFYFYPRPFCPNCWSHDVDNRSISGEGTIWSYSVVHFPHGPNEGWKTRIPYIVALISLKENVRHMSNVVDCPVDRVKSGMEVRLVYRELDDRMLPVFVPI